MRSGYSGASNKIPQYKITYNLDGTRTISFRGQIVKNSSSGVINMEAGTTHAFGDVPTKVRPSIDATSYGGTNTGNGCMLIVNKGGVMMCSIGASKTNNVDLSSLRYIID